MNGSAQRWGRIAAGALVVAILAVLILLWTNGGKPGTGAPDKPVPNTLGAKPAPSPVAVAPTPAPKPTPHSKSPTASTTNTLSALLAGLAPSPHILATLEGTVYGEGDAPLSGATVRIFNTRALGFGRSIAQTETDAEGRYRFERLPLESIFAEATAEGYQRNRVPIPLAKSLDSNFSSPDVSQGIPPTRHDFHLKPGGGVVSGVVLDATTKNPIVGARVVFMYDPKAPDFQGCYTDTEGRFSLAGLPPIVGFLSASAEGHIAGFLWGVHVGGDPLKIPLQPGGTRITGKVFGVRSHKPIDGATVMAFSPPPALQILSTETDAQGAFHFAPLGPGRYSLIAYRGQQSRNMNHRHAITITPLSEKEVWVELELPEMVSVLGRVIDEDTKEPIEGATIQPNEDREINGARAYKGPVVVTDSLGRFRAEYAASGNAISLRVSAPGYRRKWVAAHIPPDSKTAQADPIEVALQRQLRLHGTVAGASGQPVEGASITGKSSDRSPGFRGKTGPNGQFDLQVPVTDEGKRVKVSIQSDSDGRCVEEFDWPKGIRDLEKNFRLTAGGVELAVQVVDHNDAGVPGLKVRVDGRAAAEEGNVPVTREGNTDNDGIALFTDQPAGTFHIRVYRDDDQVLQKDVELAATDPTRTVVFLLEDTEHVLKGKVTNPSKEPIEGVKIMVMGRNPTNPLTTATDAEGAYRLTVSEGSVGAMFTKEGYAPKEANVRLVGKKEREVELNVTMTPALRFFGRVIDEDGKPVRGTARIQLFYRRAASGAGTAALPQYPAGEPVQIALGADGGFEFVPEYPPSNSSAFALLVTDPSRGPGWSDWVSSGKSGDYGPIEIRLSHGTLQGRVVDGETHSPVAGAIVTLNQLVDGQGDYLKVWLEGQGKTSSGPMNRPWTTSQPDGSYKLAPCADDEPCVYVYHPDYGVQKIAIPSSVGVSNVGGGARIFDIPLEPRIVWKGHLLDASGKPVDRWVLRISQTTDPGVGNHYAGTSSKKPGSEGGAFVFPKLKPGLITVTVGTGDGTIDIPDLVYTWKFNLPQPQQGRVSDKPLLMPSLVPVAVTFPPGGSVRYKLEPSNGDGITVYLSLPRNAESPNEETHTALLPPGAYKVKNLQRGHRNEPGPDVSIGQGAQNAFRVP